MGWMRGDEGGNHMERGKVGKAEKGSPASSASVAGFQVRLYNNKQVGEGTMSLPNLVELRTDSVLVIL